MVVKEKNGERKLHQRKTKAKQTFNLTTPPQASQSQQNPVLHRHQD